MHIFRATLARIHNAVILSASDEDVRRISTDQSPNRAFVEILLSAQEDTFIAPCKSFTPSTSSTSFAS